MTHCGSSKATIQCMIVIPKQAAIAAANSHASQLSCQRVFIHLQLLLECKAAAGFSVGEITALIAAQSLSVEDGKLRTFMQTTGGLF